MKKEIDKYDDIYRYLKKCFQISFGDENVPGLISINEVRKLIALRRKDDKKNNLPENSLMEIPKENDKLLEVLKETYIGRDSSYVSGMIGCVESAEEQLNGITNMALLMYMSNHLAKQFKFKIDKNISNNKNEIYRKNYKILLTLKDIAISDIIASIYVLSKTSEEYDDYFSYGNRQDDSDKATFVIDLPYIGQLCVHFGWEEKKNAILERAKKTTKAILDKKLELGQISQEQKNRIIIDLDENGILPEYEGKLYEYVGAMPIEYIGDNIKKYRKVMGHKLPEEITTNDINEMRRLGMNERELYYFFIKMGASKSLLNEISIKTKKIKPRFIENSTDEVTISEFSDATRDLKNLSLEKNREEEINRFYD